MIRQSTPAPFPFSGDGAAPAAGLWNDRTVNNSAQLVEGEDYYIEDGYYVFTASYLLKRGYCCGSGCRHCPYKNTPQTKEDED
ncbi:MAG: hypothetical protein LAP21_04035 [Acidobacteriia bacterium]|nr:hypothetical protein [Terriglobia bacterium]